MSIEKALTTYLEGLNTSAADRIYPLVLPQNTKQQSITYARTDSEHDYTFNGPDNLVSIGFQIDCWAVDYASAKVLFDEIFNKLKYQLNFVTIAGIWINEARVIGSIDVYEDVVELYRSSLLITLFYRDE